MKLQVALDGASQQLVAAEPGSNAAVAEKLLAQIGGISNSFPAMGLMIRFRMRCAKILCDSGAIIR
jgi:hypothetical protein